MKKEEMRPDGKFIEADALEAHPEFQDEYLDMVDEVFEDDKGYSALLKRIKNGPNQSTDS